MGKSGLQLAVGVLSLCFAGWVHAEPMDPALERLVTNPRCRSDVGEFQEDFLSASEVAAGANPWCSPDEEAFTKLINQWGPAIAPTAMHSARTTGFGGIHLSLEGAYTKIDSEADYWKRGTRGPIDPNNNTASIVNDSPQALLQTYSVKIRKSFGFGLEVMGTVGFMPKTSILVGGADVRLSLLEGFRKSIPGFLPDLAAGGAVRTITGTQEFQLTVSAVDAQLSKPLPLGDSSILTPWVGYQYIWIFGDSGLVDLTPATNAQQYCNFSGLNVPGNGDPSRQNADGSFTYNGQPVCNGGTAIDFNNNVVFDAVRLERQRLLVGANYQYELIMAGAEFITDVISPADAQNSDEDAEVLKDEPRQWTLVLELGVLF